MLTFSFTGLFIFLYGIRKHFFFNDDNCSDDDTNDEDEMDVVIDIKKRRLLTRGLAIGAAYARKNRRVHIRYPACKHPNVKNTQVHFYVTDFASTSEWRRQQSMHITTNNWRGRIGQIIKLSRKSGVRGVARILRNSANRKNNKRLFESNFWSTVYLKFVERRRLYSAIMFCNMYGSFLLSFMLDLSMLLLVYVICILTIAGHILSTCTLKKRIYDVKPLESAIDEFGPVLAFAACGASIHGVHRPGCDAAAEIVASMPRADFVVNATIGPGFGAAKRWIWDIARAGGRIEEADDPTVVLDKVKIVVDDCHDYWYTLLKGIDSFLYVGEIKAVENASKIRVYFNKPVQEIKGAVASDRNVVICQECLDGNHVYGAAYRVQADDSAKLIDFKRKQLNKFATNYGIDTKINVMKMPNPWCDIKNKYL